MKIAIILPTLSTSGGVGIALHYANELDRLGHSVDVLDVSAGGFSGWFPISENVGVISGPAPGDLRAVTGVNYDFAFGTFWSTIHQLRAGIVQAQNLAYFIQGDEENFYPATETQIRQSVRETYTGNELKIVVSDWLRKTLQSRYPDQNFHLIRNGINFDLFSGAPPLIEKGDKLRILVEGSVLSPLKRVRETIATLKLFKNIEVWLVSADKGSLTGIYPDLSLFSIPYREMPKIYNSCHVMVKNSETEGFSLPVIEMMASGGVPILNNIGPATEIVTSKVNGIVCETIDENSLTKSLEFIHENFSQMSASAQDAARSFRWIDQSIRLQDLLHQSFGKHTGSVDRSFVGASETAQTWGVPAVGERRHFEADTPRILRGWTARHSGGDLQSAHLIQNGIAVDLTAHQARPDVADHFGISGTYGFNRSLGDIKPHEPVSFACMYDGQRHEIHLDSIHQGMVFCDDAVLYVDDIT